MKIQSSIKNTLKKVKEQNIQSRTSQQSTWGATSQGTTASLRLQQSKSAPRLHLNYDYAMIKGNRTLKGSTFKHKNLSEEEKPLYALMHQQGDQSKISVSQFNKSLVSASYESPSGSEVKKLMENKSSLSLKALLYSPSPKTPQPKLNSSVAKKLDKYNPSSPIQEEGMFADFHPGKTTLPPIYPRKITQRFFNGD